MDVNNICRCCLTNDDPLLTIYEGGTINEDCLAAMINKVTGIKVDPDDKLPDKVCLLCIRYIKDFYAFKQKCETSHRTLLQLFLCRVEVRLSSPKKNLQTQDATGQEDIIIMGKYQMQPMESVIHAQTTVDDDYSHSVKFENNVELSNPITASSAENGISITSSPKHFQKANLSTETITHLEDCKHIPQSTTEITENPYSDSEADSCESIEFISDKPNENEEFGEMYNTNHNADVNDTAVEYVFKNVSSSQWVPEDENNISTVDKDLNVDDIDDVERPTKCNSRMEDSSNHINNVKISAASPYHCDICKQEFKLRNDLISHMGTHENSNVTNSPKPSTDPKSVSTKSLTCEICLRSFNALSTLICHRRIHTGERPFKCKYCEKTFVQKSTCSNHEIIHTGERPYKCKFCDKRFTQRGTRRTHEIIHSGVKPFKCKFCDKTFAQCGSRSTHEKIHTEDRPYKCQYCPKAFVRLHAQLMHEKLHSGEKPFKCKFCDKTFVHRGSLTTHEKVHTGERPHKCQYCQKGFLRLNAKIMHETRITNCNISSRNSAI